MINQLSLQNLYYFIFSVHDFPEHEAEHLLLIEHVNNCPDCASGIQCDYYRSQHCTVETARLLTDKHVS